MIAENESDKRQRQRKKRFYYSFAVVAVIFMQFQISRLWLHRRHIQFTPEQLKLREEALERKLSYRPPLGEVLTSQASPTPDVNILDLDRVSPSVPVVHTGNSPKVSPTPLPPPEFAYTPHRGESRIFVYLIQNKTQIKIDLFYDTYPVNVNAFVSEVLGCEKKAVKVKWLGSEAKSKEPLEYVGFLFADDLGKINDPNLRLINNPTIAMTKKLKLIGGVLSSGDLKSPQASEEEIVYDKRHALFTYIENEEANEQYALFKKILDQIKEGCKK